MMTEIHPTNASLSTMWALNNYPDLNDFFAVSRTLGFEKVELNHQVDSRMLSQVNIDHYQFSSIHEPCPADISTKELVERDWLISSTNEVARIHGIDAVKKSIDLAKQVGAPIVVVHCGTIPYTLDDEVKLRSTFKAGLIHSEEYQHIKSHFEISRHTLVRPQLQAVKKSLPALIEYSQSCGIQLGLENRYHYMDIPSIDEMESLLNLASADELGFIYDVGHAQALDRLGFYPHEEWLKRYAHRMIGCHLHDVIGLTDHFAPGLGEIDFKQISHFIPDGAFRTVEILPGNTLAQIRDGIEVLVNAGCIKVL